MQLNIIFKDLPEMALISAGNYNFRITYKGETGNDIQLLDDRTVPLTITSALSDTALICKNFSYTITAIKSPNSFNAAGLPSGLSVNTNTGQISGTPSEFGLFHVILTTSNETEVDTASQQPFSGFFISSGIRL